MEPHDLPELIRRSIAAVASGGQPASSASHMLVELLGIANAVPHERRITDDQTNASVIVDERFVVKWLRRPDPIDRGWELVKLARANGFRATPAALGRLQQTGATEVTVHEYLPGASDGWTWCVAAAVESIGQGRTSTGWPTQVGTLIGELTGALAVESTFESTTTSVHDLVAGAVTEIDAAARWNSGRLVAQVWDLIDMAPILAAGQLIVGPNHGDLHIGQILQWDDGMAVVDFDGDPARPNPGHLPYDVDLAHLLVSIELVGSVAAKQLAGGALADLSGDEPQFVDPRISDWVRAARNDVLVAYREALAARHLLALHHAEILPVLEARQLARELEYAARFLPRFAYATVGALRRRLLT